LTLTRVDHRIVYHHPLPSSNSYTQQFSDDPFTNPSKPFVSKVTVQISMLTYY
jgi:hypothetical protein